MITAQDRQVSQALAEELCRLNPTRIRKIILFGSRAQGSATSESDYDLLVIEKDPVSKREEVRRLKRALSTLPYPIDVLVMGEEEFEETKHVIGGIAHPASKYGLTLYENT